MKPVDFFTLMMCCLFWGVNFAVSAWAVSDHNIPPLFLATCRAAFVLMVATPFLFKARPKYFGRLLIVCICVGPLHLGFLYTGLQTAAASASSIVAQMMIPFATVLSVIFLKEQVGLTRSLGIAGALLGVLIMVYDPASVGVNTGLVLIVGAYSALAVGSVVMKTVGAIDWKQYVAWMALTVFITMGAGSALFETGQAEVTRAALWPLLATAVFAGLCVSIFAHGQYFKLLQTYDVSVVVPLTLMVPVFATLAGVMFRAETIGWSVLVGALLILPCVYIIARRQNIPILMEDQ